MTLAEAFEEFRGRLELDASYDALVQQRHIAVRQYVERRFHRARTQLIGSLQRRTRIDPQQGLQGFDIDILVELGDFQRFVPQGGVAPSDAMDSVESTVKGNVNYRRMGAYEDQPTIIIPYSDGSTVELVPAYRDNTSLNNPPGRAYWVPRAGRWALADYDFDAQYVSNMNQSFLRKVVPCIKMLKAWRRNLVPLLRSYHLEVLVCAILPRVIKAIEKQGSSLPWPLLLYGLFLNLQDTIYYPAQIPGSLSEPADYYLDNSDRQRIAKAAEVSTNYAKLAFDVPPTKAMQMWRELLGTPFPGG